MSTVVEAHLQLPVENGTEHERFGIQPEAIYMIGHHLSLVTDPVVVRRAIAYAKAHPKSHAELLSWQPGRGLGSVVYDERGLVFSLRDPYYGDRAEPVLGPEAEAELEEWLDTYESAHPVRELAADEEQVMQTVLEHRSLENISEAYTVATLAQMTGLPATSVSAACQALAADQALIHLEPLRPLTDEEREEWMMMEGEEPVEPEGDELADRYSLGTRGLCYYRPRG